jgi:hypothetical protein
MTNEQGTGNATGLVSTWWPPKITVDRCVSQLVRRTARRNSRITRHTTERILTKRDGETAQKEGGEELHRALQLFPTRRFEKDTDKSNSKAKKRTYLSAILNLLVGHKLRILHRE